MKRGCILELGMSTGRRTGHSWDIPASCPLSGLNLSACWQITSNGGGRGTRGRVRIVRAKSVVSEALWGPATGSYPSAPRHLEPLRRLRDSADAPPDALWRLQACPAWDHGGSARGGNHRGFCEEADGAATELLLLRPLDARCRSGGSHTQGPPYCRRLRQKRELV